MPSAEPTPAAGSPPQDRRRGFAARLARAGGEGVALAVIVPLAAALVAVVHGLLPGRILYLPVAYAYSGFIECLAEAGLFRAPVCPSVGIPPGFIPLTDGPYLVLASAVHALTGLEPLAAKAVTDAAILALSFAALMALQRRLGIARPVAALIAVCYLLLPILLGHSGIFSFYIGILLLPAYLLVEHAAFSTLAGSRTRAHERAPALRTAVRFALVALGYALVRTLALFQDPYTAVMMVAVSATILVAVAGSCLARRRFAAAAGLTAMWLVSVAVAVGLYKAWVPGGADYEVMPIDFFRAQGVDLISLFVPSGKLWWADATGAGVGKWSAYAYYGDGTNVAYNYLGYTLVVPLLVYGAWRLARRRAGAGGPAAGEPAAEGRSAEAAAAGAAGARFWPALAVAAGLCLLVALGPSLKLNDARDATYRERFDYTDYFMARESATLTLPTEKLFVTLPGLRNMRVPYRWIVIPKLVLLLGFAWVASRVYERRRALGLALAALALAEHFPDLPDRDRTAAERYAEYRRFNREVVGEMERYLVPGERVLFLSEANDYLVNYLAPRLGVSTYNVGGDKNFVLSEAAYPQSVLDLRRGLPYFERLAPPVERSLAAGDVDAVVIPYFDLRWHAYTWPPSAAERLTRRQPVAREFDPPPPPLRLAESWWFAVVSLDGDRPRPGVGAALVADPDPVTVCDGEGWGRTVLSWDVPAPRAVEIRIGGPDGKLFAQGGAAGTAETGFWVRDGMEFYLQDLTKERAQAPEHTLARLTVTLGRECAERRRAAAAASR